MEEDELEATRVEAAARAGFPSEIGANFFFANLLI
jgi:hypothetical protein